ncbi:hypothetical protein [Bartonella tamiae]|uniref:LTXXQ motif family protein n=1 Tax=Bartonella tamiae Th239 TaxID=1094558 RepID=J0R618_9HYPH|nr:hypothetical protein [Bartonella tamiae]EJF91144.1 hypothetical protein ME5_00476 [Bartonella tamiae Th239]EJF93191.1 hypothetical protein MEG_01405 [Bartonella tamiae Th307]
MKKMIFASVLASTLLAPLLGTTALAQTPPPPPHGDHHPKPPHENAPMRPHVEPHGPKHGGPDLAKHKPSASHAEHHGMHLAQRLSVMETAIGIRSDQLDAWRRYTSALVDMSDRMKSAPHEADGSLKDKAILGENMAERMIERAEKAKLFKEAASQLRNVLDEKQLERLKYYSENHPPMMHGEHKGVPPKGGDPKHGVKPKPDAPNAPKPRP